MDISNTCFESPQKLEIYFNEARHDTVLLHQRTTTTAAPSADTLAQQEHRAYSTTGASQGGGRSGKTDRSRCCSGCRSLHAKTSTSRDRKRGKLHVVDGLKRSPSKKANHSKNNNNTDVTWEKHFTFSATLRLVAHLSVCRPILCSSGGCQYSTQK